MPQGEQRLVLLALASVLLVAPARGWNVNCPGGMEICYDRIISASSGSGAYMGHCAYWGPVGPVHPTAASILAQEARDVVAILDQGLAEFCRGPSAELCELAVPGIPLYIGGFTPSLPGCNAISVCTRPGIVEHFDDSHLAAIEQLGAVVDLTIDCVPVPTECSVSPTPAATWDPTPAPTGLTTQPSPTPAPVATPQPTSTDTSCRCNSSVGERCEVDVSCATTGGLGCGAGGVATCRFCGFGAYVSVVCRGTAATTTPPTPAPGTPQPSTTPPSAVPTTPPPVDCTRLGWAGSCGAFTDAATCQCWSTSSFNCTWSRGACS